VERIGSGQTVGRPMTTSTGRDPYLEARCGHG
jgi:hypothetical protein